jgi:hypothetical protein
VALISPILDNRTFEQLRDELVKRIPAYTPEWTDHNESDPGIALLELFAHLGEALLFRFNQIPDTTKLAFLRLLGVQPRAAQPASVLLAASTELPDGVQILKGAEARAGSLPFQTDNEVYVWPLDAVAVGKVRAPTEGLSKVELERRIAATAYVKVLEPEFYVTAQVPTHPIPPDATPLDVSETLDTSLWIALLRKDTTDIARLGGRTLFVGVAFDETVPRPFELENLAPPGGVTYRSAGLDPQRTSGLGKDLPAMHWQIWNGPDAKVGSEFTPLAVLNDTTQGMVSDGVVQLELPETLPVIDPLVAPGGGAKSPPPLTDEELAARVVAWIQAARPEGSPDAIHKVRWVGLNAVSAVQSRTAAAELLGTGTGDPDQSFPLANHPVLRGTVRLQIEEIDGWHDWEEVDDLLGARADDRAFAVDYALGTVSFGRRVPQLGERIRTLSYQYGGGVAGNVPAGAVNAINGVGGVEVINPLVGAGGSDTVSLDNALDAIPAEVHRRDRAVIADDFRDLAEQLPDVIRAETLPLLHPDTPTVPAAGVVSVVIFPSEDMRKPNAPVPDFDLLRRIAKHLDRRRLVTTELYVIPPTYKPIAVSAGVAVRNGYQVDAVRRWVELILRQYLAPVPPFGPDGGGWPLGRAIRRAELEAVAVQVEGVEYLENLLLGEKTGTVLTQKELIELKRWEIPELIQITVVRGDPLELGADVEPPPPDKTPVPLPPEVC